MIWSPLFRAINPGGRHGALSILFFHRVVSEPDPLAPSEPTIDRFDSLLSWLQPHVTFLPLDEAILRRQSGNLPPSAVAVTFDDGYADNHQLAAPTLLRRGIPATFFVATAFLDGGIMWNDVVVESIRRTTQSSLDLRAVGLPAFTLANLTQRYHAIQQCLRFLKHLPPSQRADKVALLAEMCEVTPPATLMMSSSQILELSQQGFGIGAHTHNHPILSTLNDDQARLDISMGRLRLEQLLGRRVGLFAYPNGRWRSDFNERHVAMVHSMGFDAAFSTEPGVSDQQSSEFLLPRFTPWDRSPWKFRSRMLRNMLTRARPPAISSASREASS